MEIYRYIYIEIYIYIYKKYSYERTINLAELHLKTFDFMFIHSLKENQADFKVTGKENLATISSEVRNNI